MRQTDCKYERQTLCAFDALDGAKDKAAFLACMDDAPLTVAFNASFAQNCAGEEIWSEVEVCFEGDKGDALVAKAQESSKKAGGGIPKVLVDGRNVHASYEAVAEVLRSRGQIV